MQSGISLWFSVVFMLVFVVSVKNSSFKHYINLYLMQILYIYIFTYMCIYSSPNAKIMWDGFQGHENNKMNNIHS